MLSYWEKLEFVQYDFIIIGAGITGLSTACQIKEKHTNAKVLVVERGTIPTGASTKNAGFACFGTLSELVEDINLMGKDMVVSLVKQRWQGLQILRKRLGDANIEYQNYGGYELVLNNAGENNLDRLDEINNLLFSLFGQKIFALNNSKINLFGFNKDIVKLLVENMLDGQLHAGKLIKALLNYAKNIGIDIYTGVNATSFSRNQSLIELNVTSICNSMVFKTKNLAICTNAFTKELLPNIEINPGRGQVICTSEINNLKFKGTFNFDGGYFYFRNHNNRIIFGGGRNLDFQNETTTQFGSNQKILTQLNWYLQKLIIPNTPFKIDENWSGIMAFGKNKLPLVHLVEPNIAIGVRLNGMGIALGSKIGADLANLLS